MPYPKDESGKWAQETSKVAEEFCHAREKVLDTAAGRGFSAPSGDALMDILDLGQATKSKMMQSLGKIYHERRGTLFQQEEFVMKVLVQVGKLGMDLYREELLESLSLEAAEEDSWATKSRADIARLNAVTEARQTAIIRARAAIEHDIAVYKQQLVAAETVTIESERALVYAQLATAEKKLEIIDSIYKVLAAEQLVLTAEKRKIESLKLVLVAERLTADIHKAMIPFYTEKAAAKLALAEAITADIPIQKEIVELGYDRIAVENAKEAADHLVRQAQEDETQAQTDYTRAHMALELTKAQGRRMLQGLATQVKTYIQDQKQILDEEQIDLRLSSALAREGIQVHNEIRVTQKDIDNLTAELVSILENMGDRAYDHAATVKDSAVQVQLGSSTTHATTETSFRKIFKG